MIQAPEILVLPMEYGTGTTPCFPSVLPGSLSLVVGVLVWKRRSCINPATTRYNTVYTACNKWLDQNYD